jgi:hypothetical protein
MNKAMKRSSRLRMASRTGRYRKQEMGFYTVVKMGKNGEVINEEVRPNRAMKAYWRKNPTQKKAMFDVA